MPYFYAGDDDFENEPSWRKEFHFANLPFALYGSDSAPVGIAPVDEEMRLLLEAARKYPPALATAKKNIYHKESLNAEETLELIREELRAVLRLSPIQGYKKMIARITDGVEFTKGEEYWYHTESGRWINNDYEIYGRDISDFENQDQELAEN